MTREPVRERAPVRLPPPRPSDFGDEQTDVPIGYASLLGIEAERKGNTYVEARIRRQRAGTVEGS